MYYHEQVELSNVQDLLDRLTAHYRTRLVLLGDYQEANIESIYHYQLRLQAIEQAQYKLTADPDTYYPIYNEFIQELKPLLKQDIKDKTNLYAT